MEGDIGTVLTSRLCQSGENVGGGERKDSHQIVIINHFN